MDFPKDYKFKYKPLQHQWDILKASWAQPYWAWFMEMGTGKSKLTIDNFFALYMIGEIDTVVIMAKKGEYANWVYDQLPEHAPEDLPYRTYLFSTVRHRSATGKTDFANLLKEDGHLRIMVVNVESLITEDTEKALTALYKSSKRGVFFGLDESTCAAHTTSQRSKKIYLWASRSKYRRIMTGTDVVNSPMNLWGQSLVLGKGILGTTSFYSFRGRFAELETVYLGSRTVEKVVGYKNILELKGILARWSTRILKVDCLDLPEKVYTKRIVELTKSQQKMYNTLRDEAILELDSGDEVEITHVLSMITKLHQIVCGQVKIGENHYESVDNNRLDVMSEILADYEGKVIIWANYRQTLADIIARLRKDYGEEAVAGYYGGVNEADRREAVRRFQDPKDPLRFFVGNPQSAGFGITLTQAKLCIYYSNSYNLEHRLQSEDRAHRIGQTEKVTYIDLVTPDTVDERIIRALLTK